MAVLLLHYRSSSYSLFPHSSDSLPTSFANIPPSPRSSRRTFGSRQVADKSLCDRGSANGDLALVSQKPSPVMGVRLIPLKLNSCEENRSHRTSYPSKISPPISTSPTLPQTRKRRPGPVPDSIIVPTTEEEWKAVMEEVKILYLKGQYKHCSMRCKQVLDSTTVCVFQTRV
jgi:hypothetical protein